MKKLSHAPLSQLISDAPADGSPLRWGLAIATGAAIEPRRLVMSELACGNKIPKKLRCIDVATELNWLLQQIDYALSAAKPEPSCLVDAVMWAYALPMIEPIVGEASLAALCGSLDQLARHCQSINDVSSLSRLIGGGELGLALAWRRKKQTDQALVDAAVACVKQWCESPEASIGAAVRPGLTLASAEPAAGAKRSGSPARAVLASLIRSRALCNVVAKRKLKKAQLDTLADLATWVAAATRVGGTAAFSTATSRDVRDDTVRKGLLDQLKLLDPDTLGPAIDAAAGRSQTGGRLAWQISLPESFCHSELGGTAIFLPEWDVRRGRMYLDYGDSDGRLQLDAGKMTAIDGPWELLIQVDEQEQAATGPWTSLCEYTDDDVHYLELEQRWSGGIRVQRHLLLVRDDRCVMLADAVIRDEGHPPASIRYTSRIRLADQVSPQREEETTELWLHDKSGERRGLVLSLQSNEWRNGPTRAKLDVTADGHLRLEVHSDKRNSHGGSIFAPLWFDFQQRRFKRPRTWRQLTIAEDLRLVDPDEAAAYRVQQGSEQWVVYRMLHGDRTRTFLGKHLLADLFCARFHASDGGMEDLVTVGGADDDDDDDGKS
ncbi:MAG: hypothetical protein ACO1RT_18005 [Planctomycetaceae bacterium]